MMRGRFARLVESMPGLRWLTPPLFAWFVAVLLSVSFAHMGGQVGEGKTARFYLHVVQTAQVIRGSHPWVSVVMRDFTGVGGTFVLAFITIGACGYLVLGRRPRTAFSVAISILSASGAVQVLKAAFGRSRPETAFAEDAATGLSFPSGHTSMSTVVVLTLALLIIRMHASASVSTYMVAIGALLAGLVGVNRAALGVHWATDVIGDWAFGTAWAVAWLLFARHLDASRNARKALNALASRSPTRIYRSATCGPPGFFMIATAAINITSQVCARKSITMPTK